RGGRARRDHAGPAVPVTARDARRGIDARREQRRRRPAGVGTARRGDAARRATLRRRAMKRMITVLGALVLMATACGSGGGNKNSKTVTLLTHDAFAASKDVLADFTQQTGYTVKLVQPGDAGVVVNQAILTKDHPLADALFGVDNTFLTRALDAGIFQPYTPP